MSAVTPQVTRWVFTNHDLANEILWDNVRDVTRYLVYQHENAPSTGGLHQQGYIEFTRSRKLAWIKKHIHPSAHFEPARGTAEENTKYCSKSETSVPGTFKTYGNPVTQGTRTDLNDVYNDIKSGKSIKHIVDTHFPVYCKYHTGIEKGIMHLEKPRNEFPDVYLLVGPTRTGKSSFPNRFFSEDDIHRQLSVRTEKPFWGKYCQQRVVVLDEFTGQWDIEYVKQLLDRYPLTVDTKGGQITFNSTVIFITSNKPPERWWEGKEDLSPIYARLKSYLLYESGDYREVLSQYHRPGNYLAPFNEIPPSLSALLLPPSPPVLTRDPPSTSSFSSVDSSLPASPSGDSLLQEDH